MATHYRARPDLLGGRDLCWYWLRSGLRLEQTESTHHKLDGMKDVHTEHCCDKHGCKYSNENCTVTTGRAPQSYRCEDCEYEGRDIRPWGEYTVLVDASNHKVKTITIKAGQRISLQRHQKRSETWTCVTGVIMVRIGKNVNSLSNLFLYPGHTVTIPQGYIHRATAGDAEPATFIEVQTGTYFGEDDIERFEDDYGRK